MAVIDIPLRTDLPHYELQITLDQVNYALEFRWSVRESCWYLDVKQEDGTRIYAGIKVLINWPLGGLCQGAAFPPGAFFAVDTSGQNRDPGIADLGDRVRLLYFEEEELPISVSEVLARAAEAA